MKTIAGTKNDTKDGLFGRQIPGHSPWKTNEGNCRGSYEGKGPWMTSDHDGLLPKNTTRNKFATNAHTNHTGAMLGPGGVINPFGAISHCFKEMVLKNSISTPAPLPNKYLPFVPV